MKKIFSAFMIAICCLAMAMPAQAQLIKFGVKGGVNLSKAEFLRRWRRIMMVISDNATGFFIGPMAEVTIPIVGLGVDGALLFSQRGKDDGKQTGLDIPVNLKYTIGLGSMLGVFVAAGPDFFFNFSGDKKYMDEAMELEKKKAMVGINIGAGVKLIKHLQIGVNYNIPLGDSYKLKEVGEAVIGVKE